MGDVNVGPQTRTKSAERIGQRPLVTFALFAYNQERFIREAIEGAFAQTYEPLEIILSDDCSTDNTFGIMREAAAAYRGPHCVRLNRTQTNLGVFRHVLEVVSLADGELMVIAAGDDISLPERVDVFVETWRRTGASAMCSSWHVVSEKGEIVNRDVRPSTLELTLSSFITRNDGTKARSIQGATSAYQTSFLKMPIFPSYRIDGEDAIFSSIANAIGLRIEYIDSPTVLYRVHLAAISNVPEERNWSIELEERSRRRLAQHYAVGTYTFFKF